MKKITGIILSLVMMLIVAVPCFANGMELSTEVPYEHKVTITYNDGGYVLCDGKVCGHTTEFMINRFGEINLDFIYSNGYCLGKVTQNGKDITNQVKNHRLSLSDINGDIHIDITFAKGESGKNMEMQGVVYIGTSEIDGAGLHFDFDGTEIETDADGRYIIDNISEGAHVVKISKGGKVLANTKFVLSRADVEETTTTYDDDGTKVILVPRDATVVYLDFIIADENNDGIPDIDPETTDPGDPDNPGVIDPDGTPDIPGATPGGNASMSEGTKITDDGVTVDIGAPKEDVPTSDNPNTFASLFESPFMAIFTMSISLFFIILILFKRRKDEEEEREVIVE